MEGRTDLENPIPAYKKLHHSEWQRYWSCVDRALAG
jgi:hypothetical protein